jgi:hypothetical protein
MNQITAREDARAAGRKTYFTGVPCANGHKSDRMVSNRGCCECLREGARAWRAANPEKRREMNLRGRSSERGRERARRKARQWYEENKLRAYATSREWKERNKDRLAPMAAARQAARRDRRPAWQSRSEMVCFYESARRVSRCLGIPHQVDHVVPLFGKLVSGLHVPGNLRVIPASINQKKSNKFDLAIAR